jgi:hypothetical protein
MATLDATMLHILSFGARCALASRGLVLGFLDGALYRRVIENLADSARGNLVYSEERVDSIACQRICQNF